MRGNNGTDKTGGGWCLTGIAGGKAQAKGGARNEDRGPKSGQLKRHGQASRPSNGRPSL